MIVHVYMTYHMCALTLWLYNTSTKFYPSIYSQVGGKPILLRFAITSIGMMVECYLPADVVLENRDRARDLGCVEMIVQAMDKNIDDSSLVSTCIVTLYHLVTVGEEKAIAQQRDETAQKLIECDGYKVCFCFCIFFSCLRNIFASL